MKEPISEQKINSVLKSLNIEDISKTTIRQCVAVANKLEVESECHFSHLEIGVPNIDNTKIGREAQKEAIDRGLTMVYPPIKGVDMLTDMASKFIKAFIDVDIAPTSIVPTVGSMQGSYNLFLECSQLRKERDTMLFINPGFPANFTQLNVLNIKSESFDIYEYRAEKLREKLESVLSKGNIAALLYSNPNNPAWISLTEEELKIIGECATKYDVIVLEDLAYLCMDFRKDLSKPYEPPYQPTVAKYTDNYILLLSASKIFSYAGERIAVMAFSNKVFHREFSDLKEKYGLAKMGENYILTYLYCASSGVSHSAQYAVAHMMKAAIEGKYNFVKELNEYGRRAKIAKELFLKHGFHIVYDKDLDENIADGFFFTIGYKTMNGKELLTKLLRCGIVAITLNTTGSQQEGIRVCISAMRTDEDFENLDNRLGLFTQIAD